MILKTWNQLLNAKLANVAGIVLIASIGLTANAESSRAGEFEAIKDAGEAYCKLVHCADGNRPGLDKEDSAKQETLIEVPSDGIEQQLAYHSDDPGIPETMQGLWWMDGNPSGDIAVTVANVKFDPQTHIGALPVYGAHNYSYLANDKGRKAFEGVKKIDLNYVLEFNDAGTFGTLTTQVKIFGRTVRLPKWVTRFEMRLVEDGHWVRDSWIFGQQILSYDLRRIVRPDGTRDPAYADYLKFATPTSLVPVLD